MADEAVKELGRFARLHRRYPKFVDLFWPTIAPRTRHEREEQEEKDKARIDDAYARVNALDGREESELEAISRDVEDIVKTEDERRSHVETRLAAVVGLMPVLTAIVTLGVTWLGNRELVRSDLGWIPLVIALYSALQLVRALMAAIVGLKRRNYRVIDFSDVLPTRDMTAAQRRIAVLKERVRALEQNSALNGSKVEQMALAHHALLNFVPATLLFAVVVVMVGRTISAGSVPEPVHDQGSPPAIMQELRGRHDRMGQPTSNPRERPGLWCPPGQDYRLNIDCGPH
jgi:hypothetical protein